MIKQKKGDWYHTMWRFLLKLFAKRGIKKNRPNEPSVQLGCVKGESDARDYSCTAQQTFLPPEYSIPILPPVRSQLSIGSCASHAVIGAYEIIMLNTNPRRFLEGSELYHYYNARHYIANTGDSDSGMTIRDGCKTIDKYHMATEYAWLYDVGKFNVKPPFFAYLTSGAYKIKEYQRLNSLQEIKASLVQNIPVIVGIRAKKSLFGLNKSKYLYIPTGEDKGGHAVTICYYDDKREVFGIRNSWSSQWGNNGYFEMKYSDFEKFSFDWFRILLK